MFECHITIDPVLDDLVLIDLKDLVKIHGFKIAALVKRNGDLSDKDSFMTGGSDSLVQLMKNGTKVLADLNKYFPNIKVRRYKIEEIIFDTKTGTSWIS
jgi:hypothetical protein